MVDDIPAGERRGSWTNSQHQESSVTSVTRSGVGRPATAWTPARVERRLREALDARSRLASPHHADVTAFSRDPEGIGIIEGVGIAADVAVRADNVMRVTEALSWLRWLEPDEAALVDARIEGASWKAICFRFGISRPTADRRWRCAFALITWRLNGHVHAPRPAMRFLLKRDGHP